MKKKFSEEVLKTKYQEHIEKCSECNITDIWTFEEFKNYIITDGRLEGK